MKIFIFLFLERPELARKEDMNIDGSTLS